jgi:hypothetical protein
MMLRKIKIQTEDFENLRVLKEGAGPINNHRCKQRDVMYLLYSHRNPKLANKSKNKSEPSWPNEVKVKKETLFHAFRPKSQQPTV